MDRATGIICDRRIVLTLTGRDTPDHCAATLRRIRYRDPETDEAFVFLTNDFTLPALTIAALYRSRWQVELFVKWIKQHLRIKAFYGTSDNAVKTQIWIAIATYVLVAIVRKHRPRSLHNATDPQRAPIRESDASTTTYATRLHPESRQPRPERTTLA